MLHEALGASPTQMPLEPKQRGAGTVPGAHKPILSILATQIGVDSFCLDHFPGTRFPTWYHSKGPDLRLPHGQRAQEGGTFIRILANYVVRRDTQATGTVSLLGFL